MTSESDDEFVERISDFIRRQFGIADGTRIRALARRGAAMQTLEAHEFDPDPFFPAHCKCGRRFENHTHDIPLPPLPKGPEE